MAIKFYDAEMQEDFDSIDPLLKYQAKMRFELAGRIRDILKAKGLSQKDLAEILGKHESEISKWLRGFHHFSEDTLSLIEYKLGCKIHRHSIDKEYVCLVKLLPNEPISTVVKMDKENLDVLKESGSYSVVSSEEFTTMECHTSN